MFRILHVRHRQLHQRKNVNILVLQSAHRLTNEGEVMCNLSGCVSLCSCGSLRKCHIRRWDTQRWEQMNFPLVKVSFRVITGVPRNCASLWNPTNHQVTLSMKISFQRGWKRVHLTFGQLTAPFPWYFRIGNISYVLKWPRNDKMFKFDTVSVSHDKTICIKMYLIVQLKDRYGKCEEKINRNR